MVFLSAPPRVAVGLGDAEGSKWSVGEIVVGVASNLVLFFTLLAAAEDVRSFLKIRRYRSDVRDHHALLDRYGRTAAVRISNI